MYSIGYRQKFVDKTVGPGAGKYYLENKSRYGAKSYQTYIGVRLKDSRKLNSFILFFN